MPEAVAPATLCQAILGQHTGPFTDLIRPYEPAKPIRLPHTEPDPGLVFTLHVVPGRWTCSCSSPNCAPNGPASTNWRACSNRSRTTTTSA